MWKQEEVWEEMPLCPRTECENTEVCLPTANQGLVSLRNSWCDGTDLLTHNYGVNHLWMDDWGLGLLLPSTLNRKASWKKRKGNSIIFEGKLADKISNEVPLFCCLSSFHLLNKTFPGSMWCHNIFLAAAAIQHVKWISTLSRLCMLLAHDLRGNWSYPRKCGLLRLPKKVDAMDTCG